MRKQIEQKLRDNMKIPPIAIEQDQINLINYPKLLIAYRAHLRPITSITYANDQEIILTSSIDCTIRLFTLTGRYIGFMNQLISYGPLNSSIILKKYVQLFSSIINKRNLK